MPELTKAQLDEFKSRYKFQRDTFDSEYRSFMLDISNFIVPRNARFLQKRDSQRQTTGKRRQYIINGHAGRSQAIAQNGMKGGLVPQSLPWFKLSMFDTNLMSLEVVKEWLSEVEKLMYAVFAKSNFYQSMGASMKQLVNFATAPIQIFEDLNDVIRVQPWYAGEYVLLSDGSGRVDTGFRESLMTARGMKNRFGEENLSDAAKSLLQTNPDQPLTVINCIFPREKSNPDSPFNLDMPFGSVYWEDGVDDKVLGETGFRTKALSVSRWDIIADDPYGADCPGMSALPDVMMLQKLERDKLEALEKVVRPPIVAPSGMRNRLSTMANAMNYTSEGDKIKSLYEIRPDIAAISAEIREVESRISEGYFNDLFLLISSGVDGPQQTAFEVARKQEEKLTILGPVIEDVNNALGDIVDRTFDIMQTRGMLPDPPAELVDAELKVEFTSILTQAQKAVGVSSVEAGLSTIGRMADLNPAVLDKVDFDNAVDVVAEGTGLDPKIIRSNAEAGLIRRDREQQQQQQQQLEAMPGAAKAAKDLSDAGIDPQQIAEDG